MRTSERVVGHCSSRKAPDTPADEPQIPTLAKLHPTSPPETDFLTLIDLDITTHIAPGLSTVSSHIFRNLP